MSVIWDINARRIAGIRSWVLGSVWKDGILAFVSMVPVAAVTYLSTWTGWFLSKDAYDRHWAATNPAGPWGWVPDSLRSLWHYHSTAYSFHTGLGSDHPYKANAWSWFVMGRPTSFYVRTTRTATADAQWTSAPPPHEPWQSADLVGRLAGHLVPDRPVDCQAGLAGRAILCGFAAGFVPWLFYPGRTIFFFYAIAYEPFMILAIVLVLGMVMGKSRSPWRRQQGAVSWASSWSWQLPSAPTSTPSGLRR